MNTPRKALADDVPKSNPWEDDKLGFKPFCERLSKVVIHLAAPNGYVLGLHGEWGSGKSTALNFLCAFIDKHNQECETDLDKLLLVDFRPWIVSGHQDLIAAFFKVLTENLGDNRGWCRKRLDWFLRALKFGGDPLIDAVATVAVTVDPSGGVASKGVGTIAKKSLHGLIAKFLDDPSLQTAYERLKEALLKSEKKFLVIVDDLDRLEDEEIKSIMQMVKTVGRLPNVIYLLAYDRAIVWHALDGGFERAGPHFAEKIIQQELELPKPSRHALLSMLDGEIEFLNEEIDDSLRWQYIVRDGINRWIRHPRDVLRLSNAIKFSWPALQGEIDPADLLAMEGIRLFDQEAFEWVRWNRDFIFSEGAFRMSMPEADQAVAARLKERLPEETRSQLLKILTVLFPTCIKAFEGDKAFQEEAFAATSARRGVGCVAGYDAYFSLHPSSDAISKALIDSIMDDADGPDLLRKTIDRYVDINDSSGQPMIGQLIDEIRNRFYGQKAATPTQAMLDIWFEFGEKVISTDWTVNAFILSPRARLSYLIGDMLEAWRVPLAGERLLESFSRCKSPAFCAEIFVDRAGELGKLVDRNHGHSAITEKTLGELGQILLLKIETAAINGSLASAPFYSDIVRAWSFVGKIEDVRSWLNDGMMSSPTFLAKVSRGLVSFSMGTSVRVYSMRSRPPVPYDIGVIHEAAQKHKDSSELSDDDRALIKVVLQGTAHILESDSKKASVERASIDKTKI